MAEYIEREAALASVRPDNPMDEQAAVTIATAKELVRKALKNAPAADVVPVVHSKWEISCDGYYPCCKRCKAELYSGVLTKYCPECGAKMDGGATHDD